MPILTAQTHILSILADLYLPGWGGSTLDAVIRPPNPLTDQVDPVAFIWPSDGPEHRESVPRPQNGTPGTGSTQAGWKQMRHALDIWVLWYQDAGDPVPDQSFAVIMDAIMDALRCSADPVKVQDPVTFRWSQLFKVGEDMEYHIDPPVAVIDQRTLEYRGRVLVRCYEEFQA